MKRKITVFAILFFIARIMYASGFDVINIEPTPFFPRMESSKELKQIVRVSLVNGSGISDCQVIVKHDDKEEPIQYIDDIKKGNGVYDVLIPDLERPTLVTFIFKCADKVLAEKTVNWKPQKKWKVYYAAVSHQDLSFETYFQYIRRGVREEGLDLALKYCRETDDWEDDCKFRWNVETSEPILRWANKRDIKDVEELVSRIKEGRIELGAIHNTISSQMAGYEVLARTFYMPNRYVVDKLGIDPAKVAIINDVTGITRSWPLYSKEANIPYLKHGSNTPNCLDDLRSLPVFNWKSNDGDTAGGVLCQTGSYYSEDKLNDWTEEEMEKMIKRHETPEWAYDCILAYDSHDFALPTLDNAKKIREWNKKYAYPRVICSLISSYFDDVISQKDKAYIMDVDKDAPDCWDDQDAADSELLSLARRTTSRLSTAEKLSTIAMTTSTGGSPDKELYQAYHGLVSYHEHNNGVIHGGNHQFYETDKEMNRRLVKEASAFTDSVMCKTLPRLNSLIKTKKNSIIVYNSLNWKRNDIVTINKKDLPNNINGFSLIDISSGKQIPVQKLSNGNIIFYADNIPSMGYKVYNIFPLSEENKINSLSLENTLENDYYKIELDRKKNIISHIYDKTLKCDIIDHDSPYALGEYIYYDHFQKKYLKTEFEKIEYIKGDIADEIQIYQKAYLAKNLKLTVTVYHNLKKIDFSLTLDKLSNEEPLVGSWNRRFLEAMFCAIPVKVPNFIHNHELAGAVTQPGNPNMQLNSAEAAYYAIQHFADASNDKMGVTVSTIDAALVEYGYPRPGLWNSGARKPMEPVVKPKNSNMFLYIMNNFFSTNICVDQPGKKQFDFAIRSHSGNWVEGKAYKFAWETSHPLVPSFASINKNGILPSKYSFIDIDCDNVICTSFKPAEFNGVGYIARFFELSGKKTNVTVKFNCLDDIKEAYYTDLLEVNKSRIKPYKKELAFDILPHGITTLRVQGKDYKREVRNLNASAISDAHISLKWDFDKFDNLSHFAIYRSNSSDCPATPFNYIGYTKDLKYDDIPCLNYAGWNSSFLQPDRTYYYRIVPVNRYNMPGTESEVIACKTLTKQEKDERPSKVQGLYAVHVSPLAPENYINLFFYTNIESDIDRYEIFRGNTIDFTPSAKNLIGSIKPQEMTLNYKGVFKHSELECQMFSDKSAEVNKDYYYCVRAVDFSGNAGNYSDKVKIRMNYVPVEIKVTPSQFEKFENAVASVMVEIKTSLKDCDLYYTTDNSEPSNISKKYTSSFILNNNALIKVAVYDKMSKTLMHKKMFYVTCPRAVAQSSINEAWNAPMAFDGNEEIASQWQCMQYGGGSKEKPKDTWLGFIFPEKLKIKGVVIIGDDRDIMPVQENYRIYTRLNGIMSLSGELKSHGVNLGKKNHNKIVFDKVMETDGVMLYVPSLEYPKSLLADQDGIVRVVEFKLIMEDGSVKNLKELLEKESIQKDGALLQAAKTAANL